MATSSIQTKCSISHCDEEINTFLCRGCSKDFCFRHIIEHQQFVNEQLNLIQDDFNQFRQNLIDMKNNSPKHLLIEQIDQWENESIRKIKEKANQCRQFLDHYTKESINQIEMKLNQTNEQMNSNEKQKKDFNEIYLNQLKQTLEELNQQLNQHEYVFIEQKSNLFICEISVRLSSQNQTWKQFPTTVAGGHGLGNRLNQLSSPLGIFIDDDQTIVITDTWNHRIVEWKNNSNDSQVIAGGNEQGSRINQLNQPTSVIIDQQTDSLIICDYGNRRVVRWPRRNGQTGEVLILDIRCYDLKMDNDGYLYVSDVEKHEIRRWKIGENNGTIVAGGNGKGNRTDQLNYPRNIFIDEDHSVYVSDEQNHRVMKWMKDAKEGIVVAGGQGRGNGLNQLSSPRGIIVDQLGSVYVADWNNDRVMRWLKEAEEGTIVVGGNEGGEQSNQLNQPVDLSFDRANSLYVVDLGNHRVQRFDVN